MNDDVKAHAETAKVTVAVPDVEIEVTAKLRGRGGQRVEARKLWRSTRPRGLTTIEDDEQLRAPIREMRRDRVRVTQQAVAARSGFTLAMIRGYLKVTHRTWAEFLLSF